jgi:hypothetical protein
MQRALRAGKREAVSVDPSDEDLARVRSVDDLVVVGNQDFGNLDNVDFAGFRNDRESARENLAEIKKQVDRFHPEGRGKAYNADVRRVVHARYLQGHGVQLQAHLDVEEMAQLRKYVERQDSAPNVADAVRSLNLSLEQGQQDVGVLVRGAEQALFAERGINGAAFGAGFAKLDVKALQKTRDFADAWAPSQAGRFLGMASGQSFEDLRSSMAFSMLADRGYRNTAGLDLSTVLSLLRDIEVEGPRSNSTIAATVNAALEQGETNYFRLSTLANQALLEEIGLSREAQASLEVSDADLLDAFPDKAPAEARAERTRVLRDVLRVLPDRERVGALEALQGSDLIGAEKALSKHLGRRIRQLGRDSIPYVEMGAMQRANLATALAKLPEEVRREAFQGRKDHAADRLADAIETRFGLHVHRTVGEAPGDNEEYGPYVEAPTVQTLSDLYNALGGMSREGHLPPGLGDSTTVAFMVGAPPSPSMTPVKLNPDQDPIGPFDRPGASAHQRGQSGFFGECGQDENGNDELFLFDDAVYGPNGDSPVGVTLGESTYIHELSHAIQLGGVPGAPVQERERSDRLNTAEWASLSRWIEPGQKLADGAQDDYLYYYDPGVQVGHREQVATSYGASDPSEDFAEFTPFFFKDPETAMGLSPEKFLYTNRFMGNFYGEAQVAEIGRRVGLSAQQLEQARVSMTGKVAAAPALAGIA